MARREMTRKSTDLPCSQQYLTNSQVRPLFHRFLMDETRYASSSRMNTDERDITNGASIERAFVSDGAVKPRPFSAHEWQH